MENYKFAVFILSHGRPDNIKTIRTLKSCGYTGEIYIIIDDLDESKQDYIDEFGDYVRIFDKLAVAKTFDRGDNWGSLNSTSFVRNKTFDIAREIGLDYFIQLDDDYTSFSYRFDTKGNFVNKKVLSLDGVFHSMCEYMSKTDILSLTMAQGGDFIGGKNAGLSDSIKIKRKAMNSFMCKTDRPFIFVGSMNEDVNMYLVLGKVGKLLFTVNNLFLGQAVTQSSKGGMTDVYKEKGTYVKSFYSVMYSPSCVKISMMGTAHRRIHHKINWRTAVPKIVRELL